MTKEDWIKIKHFNPSENWGSPEKMSPFLLLLLDRLRESIKVPIIIHCGTNGTHCRNSCHYQGLAVDCHAKDISLLTLYLASERFPFGGIGVYPNWNNPGLHLDTRPVWFGRKPEARWGGILVWDKTKKQMVMRYVALDDKFVERYLISEKT